MKQPSIKKNAFMSSILTMSSFLFPMITFPYVSRILLPSGMGKINFATSVVSYFAMFAQLGIPTYGIRACAKVRDDKEALSKTVQELVAINLLTCVLVYAAFGASLVLVPKFREERTLLEIISVTIFLNAIGTEWLYRALEQFSYITARSVIFKFISVIAMFILIHGKQDYLLYGAISVFASSASNVLNFINLRKFIFFRPLGGYDFKRHVKPVMIFFALSITTTVYTNLDNVMLGFMKGDAQVGYYSASVKVKSVLTSLVISVGSVLLPRTSYYAEKGYMEEFCGVLAKTMHFILLVSIPVSVYFTIFARECILFLSGNSFGQAILPMQIMMPTVVLIGISNTIGIQMLVPLGKEKQVAYSTFCGAVTDFILNSILIPRFASLGAAVGTLAAEAVVVFCQYRLICKEKERLFSGIKWGRIAVASGCAVMACIWVKFLHIGVFLTLLVSVPLFFGAYFILMWAIVKEEYHF